MMRIWRFLTGYGRHVDITVELGLQSANAHTLAILNRCHTVAEFIDAALRIGRHGFGLCTHIIADLPWDDRLDVVEAALAEHQVKLSQLNVVLQMGSTESIKLFLENSEVLGIVSIRAVTRELMSGRLKVIEVEGFRAERMFTFAEPQGQSGGVEESFIRYACQNWR